MFLICCLSFFRATPFVMAYSISPGPDSMSVSPPLFVFSFSLSLTVYKEHSIQEMPFWDRCYITELTIGSKVELLKYGNSYFHQWKFRKSKGNNFHSSIIRGQWRLRFGLYEEGRLIVQIIYLCTLFQISCEQQTICSVLDTRNIGFETIDIAAPGMEIQRDFMRKNGMKREGQRNVLPPQIFNGETFR